MPPFEILRDVLGPSIEAGEDEVDGGGSKEEGEDGRKSASMFRRAKDIRQAREKEMMKTRGLDTSRFDTLTII